MDSEQQITLKPIGFVSTKAVGDEVKDKTRTSEIIINPELIPALDGITSYSHLYILFWMKNYQDWAPARASALLPADMSLPIRNL